YVVHAYEGPDGPPVLVSFNWDSFGNCFPILVGAFGSHYNIPALYREVAPGAGSPNWGETLEGRMAFRKMMRVIFYATSISAIFYGFVGVVAYSMFGSATKGDFTENFRQDDSWLVAVRLLMAFAICASFPLTLVSARSAVLNIFLQPTGVVMTRSLRLTLSTALTALCLGVGEAVGDISTVLAYNGSVFGTPVCFLVPAIMYLMLPRETQKGFWRASCILCAIAGIAFGLLGIWVVAATP
ncbi:unnamed protein product, partial [Polarella glacialis]